LCFTDEVKRDQPQALDRELILPVAGADEIGDQGYGFLPQAQF
jgi:hypothetical protein